MTTEAELLAQIYADPLADGPRLVYADLLQERGDPRGELIALQILRRDTPRERELIAAHAKAWLGPLGDVVETRDGARTTFERGFLAVAELARDAGPRLAAVLHDPAWATVEEVCGWDARAVLAEAPLAGLRRIGSMLPVDQLEALASRPTPLPNLTHVTIALFGALTAAQRRALATCAGLAGLRELVIAPNWALALEDITWLLGTLVASRLDRLVIRRPGRPRMHDAEERRVAGELAKALERWPVTTPRLSLATPDGAIELVAGPAGRYARAS